MHAEINKLRFEKAIDGASEIGNGKSFRIDLLVRSRIPFIEYQLTQSASPRSELDRLTRQFRVDVAQVRLNKYDLSASRYRQADNDETYHESPQVTLEHLSRLEQVMLNEINQLKELLK